MNNGQLHDRLMLDPIEACLRGLGAEVTREKHLGAYGHSGIVDLFAVLRGTVLLIEAETRCTKRVLNDVWKAHAVAEDQIHVGAICRLVIVVPTRSVAQAVLRKLQRARREGGLDGVDWNRHRPIVLTAGYACHWLYKTFQPSVPRCSSRLQAENLGTKTSQN